MSHQRSALTLSIATNPNINTITLSIRYAHLNFLLVFILPDTILHFIKIQPSGGWAVHLLNTNVCTRIHTHMHTHTHTGTHTGAHTHVMNGADYCNGGQLILHTEFHRLTKSIQINIHTHIYLFNRQVETFELGQHFFGFGFGRRHCWT